MKITEVRVFPKEGRDTKLRAFVNITFDDCFVVRGLKVIEGQKGHFVVMPSRKVNEHEHRDVAHPITAEYRDYIEKEVLDAYESELSNPGSHSGDSQDDAGDIQSDRESIEA